MQTFMFFPGVSVKEEEQAWIVCNKMEGAKRRIRRLKRGELGKKTNVVKDEG